MTEFLAETNSNRAVALAEELARDFFAVKNQVYARKHFLEIENAHQVGIVLKDGYGRSRGTLVEGDVRIVFDPHRLQEKEKSLFEDDGAAHRILYLSQEDLLKVLNGKAQQRTPVFLVADWLYLNRLIVPEPRRG